MREHTSSIPQAEIVVGQLYIAHVSIPGRFLATDVNISGRRILLLVETVVHILFLPVLLGQVPQRVVQRVDKRRRLPARSCTHKTKAR
jgi:hypothetical protein